MEAPVFTSPGAVAGHGEKKNPVSSEGEDRYPLIMAVRIHCVWEKVVIEEGASPWKSEPERLSENNDRYDEALLMWNRWGQERSCGRGQRNLLWRH